MNQCDECGKSRERMRGYAIDLNKVILKMCPKCWKELDMDNDIMNKFIFLMAQDLYELAQEEPSLLPWLALPVVSGAVSTQTYPRKQ